MSLENNRDKRMDGKQGALFCYSYHLLFLVFSYSFHLFFYLQKSRLTSDGFSSLRAGSFLSLRVSVSRSIHDKQSKNLCLMYIATKGIRRVDLAAVRYTVSRKQDRKEGRR